MGLSYYQRRRLEKKFLPSRQRRSGPVWSFLPAPVPFPEVRDPSVAHCPRRQRVGPRFARPPRASSSSSSCPRLGRHGRRGETPAASAVAVPRGAHPRRLHAARRQRERDLVVRRDQARLRERRVRLGASRGGILPERDDSPRDSSARDVTVVRVASRRRVARRRSPPLAVPILDATSRPPSPTPHRPTSPPPKKKLRSRSRTSTGRR